MAKVRFTRSDGTKVSFTADDEAVASRKAGKRKLSAYNRFVRDEMAKGSKPDSQQAAMAKLKRIAKAWKARS